QDRSGTATTFAFDNHGNLLDRVENDDDFDATTQPADLVGRPQTMYFFDSVDCPHTVTEVRRPSTLSTDACTRTTADGCQRTGFTLDAHCNVLRTEESGFTFATTDPTTPSPYCYATNRCYDFGDGRITAEVGPL